MLSSPPPPSPQRLFSYPSAVAVSPDGRFVYISNTGEILVMDTATNTITNTIRSVDGAMAFSPGGRYLYVTDSGSGNVSVIDTATNTVVRTISAGGPDTGMAISPDGQYLYVPSDGARRHREPHQRGVCDQNGSLRHSPSRRQHRRWS